MHRAFRNRVLQAIPVLGLLVCLWSSVSVAAIDVYDFENEALRQRYLAFIDELRCPKCQNQNLAGSDSPIASDLRRELRRLLEEGKSDQEIVDFMVSRYGEYVLYRPRVQNTTLALWGLPAVLLGLACVCLMLIVRRRRTAARPAGEGESGGDLDQARLAELLEQAAKRDQSHSDANQ